MCSFPNLIVKRILLAYSTVYSVISVQISLAILAHLSSLILYSGIKIAALFNNSSTSTCLQS